MTFALLAQAVPPQIPDPVVVTQTGPLPPWETMPPQVMVLITFAVVAGAVLVLAPLVRALARRIEGGSRKLEGDVADLRARLEAMEQQAITSGEFEATDHRMYELEERLEFLERVLARGKETGSGS